MASQNYPQVPQSHPDLPTPNPPSSSSSYPTVDTSDLNNLIPDDPAASATAQSEPAVDETLLAIPGAILHLIDKRRSVELSTGDLRLHRLSQGPTAVALFASVASAPAHDTPDSIQWPITRDTAAVKLDSSHYFFSLRVPGDEEDGGKCGSSTPLLLNYGLTLASKGQESLLSELDEILGAYCSFSIHKVNDQMSDVLDSSLVKQITAVEVVEEGPKKDMMEERSAAYWTTLAPNVEDYSGSVAKGIAKGSGHVVKGIIWCGDVTVDRIKWGNESLKNRLSRGETPAEVSPETLTRIKRIKAVSHMSEKVATGVLTGVVKVSGFVTSSVAKSRVGKKVIALIPEEVVVASLDGFGRICDAVETAGKNVLSTSSTATTGLVSHRYGEQAAEATNEGLDAAGHAIGTAWAVFKLRKALDPRSAFKPTALAKSASSTVAEIKSRQGK